MAATEATPLQGAGGYNTWLKSVWEHSPGLRLGVCSGGILLWLGMYGFLQERIMAMPYGNGEYFSHSVYIVLQNRIISASFAFMMVLVNGESPKATPPLWKYAAISVSNVCATTCQYEALKFVSFPVQMLGKSSKMVPVMGWGMGVSGKRYGYMDWLIALAVTLGCTFFLLGGDITSMKHRHAGDEPGAAVATMGLMLMVGYLICDGFTSVYQEKLFGEYNVTIYNQMLWVNIFAAITSCGALLIFGGFTESMAFSARHPVFVADALMLSASATLGQVSIYMTIAYFGALVFAATMNCRQMVSIVLSIVYYAHPVTLMQIGGITLCFAGLTYKTYLGHLHFASSNAKKAADAKAVEEDKKVAA